MLSSSGSIESLLVELFALERWTVLVAVTGSCMVKGDRSPREKEVAVLADDAECLFLDDGNTAVVMPYVQGRSISIGGIRWRISMGNILGEERLQEGFQDRILLAILLQYLNNEFPSSLGDEIKEWLRYI